MAIVPRLRPGNLEENSESIEKMDEYAREGLRTLIFAKKDLQNFIPDEYQNGNVEGIENELTFLGVTGLEDLLQDNAAQCIRDFREAKMKVWMLTGDKEETAQNISISCGIIDPQS